ncbi:lytic transglycosylase domain-containing protein [Fontisphaera persica]|uniref:lytic transglycosylase domain-containing protein n=1 Tax=Fontisphaera persica TaxID=2974023 RepID=UPI0024C0440E|nr:lytic transglycosylase domain-containing protein [Fontisphaera persica]WCJ59859.1 lytic transglycosylase domain-containing protein [Fontisphaera persica]
MRLTRWQKWLLVIVALGGLLWLFDRWRLWQENAHDKTIAAAARKYGVDPALIKAVIWRESRFDPKARGRRGEVGLMQIMEPTARDWAKAENRTLVFHTELFDPQKNIECGTWYLRRLLLRYPQTDNPLPYALADYNAGRANVLKWLNGPAATNSAAFVQAIGFPSTRAYVIAVMERHAHYRKTWRPPKS